MELLPHLSVCTYCCRQLLQAAAAACCILADKLELTQLQGVQISANGMPRLLSLVLQVPAAACCPQLAGGVVPARPGTSFKRSSTDSEAAVRQSFCSLLQAAAAACCFLAGKLEENQLHARYLLLVFDRIERRREGKSLRILDFYSQVRALLLQEASGRPKVSQPGWLQLTHAQCTSSACMALVLNACSTC